MKKMAPGAWPGLVLAAAAVMISGRAAAMQAPLGMVEQPCPPPLALPDASRALLTELFMVPRTVGPADFARLMGDATFAAYDAELRRRGATDWAGLCRYQAANAAQAPGSVRAVFIGDSITENWLLADPALFSGGIVNRGIGAQTSAQMLVRFRADVIALSPAVVHILAGTNDVAGNNGPLRPQDYRNNIESMVEIARAHGVRVVLGSIPPVARFGWQPTLQPARQVVELNRWLQDYARRNGLGFVDYHAALRDAADGLDPAFGNDGVHPNRDGYAVMRRLVGPLLGGGGGG